MMKLSGIRPLRIGMKLLRGVKMIQKIVESNGRSLSMQKMPTLQVES